MHVCWRFISPRTTGANEPNSRPGPAPCHAPALGNCAAALLHESAVAGGARGNRAQLRMLDRSFWLQQWDAAQSSTFYFRPPKKPCLRYLSLALRLSKHWLGGPELCQSAWHALASSTLCHCCNNKIIIAQLQRPLFPVSYTLGVLPRNP